MQDRFKFRIFEYETKEMVELDAVGYSSFDPFAEGKSRLIMIPSGLGNTFHYDKQCLYDNDKFSEPMQCTGLKDKNGKLIYEGDKVIYYHEKKHLVPVTDKKPFEAPYGMDEESGLPLAYRTKKIIRYKGVVSVCPLTGVDINLGNRCHWWSGITKDNVLPKVEVIGNIYENPVLLEVSDDY